MPNLEVLEAIETGELITQVDASRPAGDPFKLPAPLATVVSTRLTNTRTKNAAATVMEGSTAGAAREREVALGRIRELLRNGYSFIKSVARDDLSDAERENVFTAYGWEGGLIGDLESPTRVEAMADLADTVTGDPAVPTNGKYPATLVSRITDWHGILDAATLIANGGDLQVLFKQRDDAAAELREGISRVRGFYVSASDDRDKTPELARIGMQPRRDPGEAQPQPLPAAPGTATFDAATRQLTVPAMPAHATSLRAYRQPAGGSASLAGVSASATVSVVGIAPLTPGVTYEVWAVGKNSRGEGPASNKITFTA